MNANTLTVVTGSPSLAYAVFGYDLAAVLNNGDELRILPVISQGAFQNVRDVRYLYGVDIGFAQTNILGHYRRTGEIADVGDKIVYIAKICNEEVHVVTRSNITSLEQLQGRKVNFNTAGSGTQLSARDIFERFGVKVEEVNMRQNDGLEKLKSGEIAATVLTSGKPSEALAPEGQRWLSHPARSLHQDAASRLPALGPDPRGLSQSHRDRSDRRHDRERNHPVCIQLAEELRPLPPH
jgi:TRAP-type uncharacterized transport system substrate-binding protein